MEALIAAITKIDSVPILVLLLVCGGLGWLHLKTIQENRLDRQALMDLLTKNTDALNGIKNWLAASTGKVIP